MGSEVRPQKEGAAPQVPALPGPEAPPAHSLLPEPLLGRLPGRPWHHLLGTNLVGAMRRGVKPVATRLAGPHLRLQGIGKCRRRGGRG